MENGIQIRIKGTTLKADFKTIGIGILKGLAKTAAAINSGGFSLAAWPNVISDFGDVIKGFALDITLERRAWLLVSGAIFYSIEKILISDRLGRAPTERSLKDFIDTISARVSVREYTLEPDFFHAPNKLALLDDVAHELSSWISALGSTLTPAAAKAELEKHFPSGLHRIWLKNTTTFKELETALSSPFAPTLKLSAERDAYLQYIEDDFSAIRLIGQEEEDPKAVRLAQVFLPLRAFYFELDDKQSRRRPAATPRQQARDREEPNVRKRVTRLFNELETWAISTDRRDALRIISGGPGIGKSSSMRAFAAKIARDGHFFPILIPLQKLANPDRPLRTRIDSYLTENKEIQFSKSPLDIDEIPLSRGPLLLIFDGLDELVRPGKDADEIAKEFIFEIQRLLESENGSSRAGAAPRMIAIVAGRIAMAESAAKALKLNGPQLLHLLRFVEDDDSYFDPDKLLREDQRKTWWKLWHKATPGVPSRIPSMLLAENLFDVTVEPMLLYFIAFIQPWASEAGEEELNRNWLYQRLLEDFYERELAKGDRNFATEFQTFHEYEAVLQGMALAAWYDGSTRTASIDTVFSLLAARHEGLANSLSKVIGANKPEIGAALAFYMKPGERPNSIEFLHKTFAEYLVARRIVQTIEAISDDFKTAFSARNAIKKMFDEQHHLLEWLKLMGPRSIDTDLLKFLRDEVSKVYEAEPAEVKHIRESLIRCIQVAIKTGMPAHQLFISGKDVVRRPDNFREATEQGRNAEEALWATLNATIRPALGSPDFKAVTILESEENWFLALIYRFNATAELRDLRAHFFDGLSLQKSELSLENLSHLQAAGSDFSGSDLSFSQLLGCDLRGATFIGSDMFGCEAFDSHCAGANFSGCSVSGGEFRACNLEKTSFQQAEMERCNFEDSNLRGASFRDANLKNANLNGVQLAGVDFSNANLSNADIRNANLTGANFTGATLAGTKMENANITNVIGFPPEVIFSVGQDKDRE